MRIFSVLTLMTFAASLASLSSSAARADAAADTEAAAHAYSLSSTKELKLKVGESGAVHVEVVPNAGDHVSPEAPVSLSAAAQPVFDLPKLKLSRADAKSTAAQGVEFSLPVVGKEKGRAELKAQLSFYICVATLCAHQKREIAVPVQVE